jgi:hypothetical protein
MSNFIPNFLGGPFGSPGAPGYVPPSATASIAPMAGTSMATMANRYNQLGLTPPGGGIGTPEAMDLGLAPSVTGGIPGQFGAVAGQIQNRALTQSPQGSGKSTSPASLIGSIGNLFNQG